MTSIAYPAVGSSTHFFDTHGKEILVGDLVILKAGEPTEQHGDYTICKVEVCGVTPMLVFFCSQKRNKVPPGSMGCPLMEKYDPKQYIFANDHSTIRPNCHELIVISHDGLDQHREPENGSQNTGDASPAVAG